MDGIFSAETLALAHNGVVGMKWGKHTNPNYGANQQKRDTQIYGNRGATRINKSLNKGNSISVARGDEKTRRDTVMGKNKYVRQGGKIAGGVTGVVVANVTVSGIKALANSRTGAVIASKILGQGPGAHAAYLAGRAGINELASNPILRVAVSAGAAKVGVMLSGDLAVNTRMRLHGYNPNRK